MDDIEQRLRLSPEELRDWWQGLNTEERVASIPDVGREDAEELFFTLSAQDQADLVLHLPQADRRSWVRLLTPAAAADLVQAAAEEDRAVLLALLDETTRKEVTALMAYAEDDAGGLMSPRFARVRPDMTVDEAITYLRKQAREYPHTVHYVYVLESDQRLLGIVSYRQLIEAPDDKLVREVMNPDPVTVPEDMDQEAVSTLFKEHELLAIPVVDSERRMKGVVTVHDIVDVVQEEATEDIQKMGGTEALEAPYPSVGVVSMLRKRSIWLCVLFLGESLTATAMAFFEHEIARAVVLTLFIPLIISSGGNSGSQATTLVVRAMALGEVRLRDWWRVVRREIVVGLGLGAILGVLGFVRIVGWHAISPVYGEHYMLVAGAISVSLLGVVAFGTFVGSMLPFILRRLGLDPASASAPFVATLVDITGLVIYFSVAAVFLSGTLL